MADFTIKRNDTAPILAVDLTEAGNPYDLTGASAVKFIMRVDGAPSAKVDAAATISDASAGTVTYEWSAADTDTEGLYNAEFEVTDSNLKVLTFPNEGYFTIEVIEDLA